ncbi:hypothetical protein GIB67_029270 [Kingdonia uniflora]|uniref:Uncharacterized protein n=1 Tax=Kingdonia uniflora TaxID=39325 RepID=A0A7J7N863_9MAGN|nr:hypothetical protein GIB67_029270 [Kingdonia uniflora]
MPTITTLALESLIEPTRVNNNNNNNVSKRRSNNHLYISHPALYTTPDPTPIPPNSSMGSDTPSPYVVNRKRRDLPPPTPTPTPPKVLNQHQGIEIPPKGRNPEVSNDGVGQNVESRDLGEVEVVECDGRGEGGSGFKEFGGRDEGGDEFFDPRDSMSVASSMSDSEDFRASGRHTTVSNQSDFFDVDEEFSDCSIPNVWSPLTGSNMDSASGLHAARVNLFDEIERRKRAEDALAQLHSQWQRIREYLSQIGLSSFPETWNVDKDRDLEMDMAEQFCQDVVVSRFISEVIGRSLARAEAEEAAEAVIETKNQEISRLRDKLQYYETVNHEMSQRNQEVLETARRQRELRKRKQRWIWSGIGFTMAIGASVLAYSYLPSTSRHESASSSSDLSYVPPDSTESA